RTLSPRPTRSPENRRTERYGRRNNPQQLWDVLQRTGKVFGSGAPPAKRACHLGRRAWSRTSTRCRCIVQYLNSMETPRQIFRGGNRSPAFLGHLDKGV